MFCRKCGKEIEEDSVFCKYCGAQLDATPQPNTRTTKRSIRSLYHSFWEISKGWQIFFILYAFWVLCWFGYAIFNADQIGHSYYYENVACPTMLAIFGVPLLAFVIWYIKKNRNNPTKDIASELYEKKREPITTQDKSLPEIERFSLQDFALLYGKMQVVKVKTVNGEFDNYCTFTNGDVVKKVIFDESVGILNAAEISMRKAELCIVEKEGMKYYLTLKS